MKNSGHIQAIFIDLKFRENVLDPEIIFCQCCNSTEKVTISEFSLQNVFRLDGLTDEFSVGNDFCDSSPLNVFSGEGFSY